MIFCNENLSAKILILILSQLAVKDTMRIVPLMFDSEANLKVVCPYCSFEKRTDSSDLLDLSQKDYWLPFFEKKRSKLHRICLTNPSSFPVLEPGFSLRSTLEKDRRSRYANIDTPIFRELGFKGYRFDKSVFCPLGVYSDGKKMRLGIPHPDLLDEWPILQRTCASLMFRVREVLPIIVPELLPIASIGDIKVAEPIENRNNVSSQKKHLEMSKFVSVLLARANKKKYRVFQKSQQNEILSENHLEF